MRILFVIGNFKYRNTGVGGHYYSAVATCEALNAGGHHAAIVCIGSAQSPVLERWTEGERFFIPYTALATHRCILALRTLILEQRADVVHAFDTASGLFARIAAGICRKPIALTVPGGPPPKKYAPLFRNTVVFSQELKQYYSRRRGINLSLIVNRVVRFECPDERTAPLIEKKKSGRLVILRIARIEPFYEKSLLQTVALSRFLTANAFPNQVFIVGQCTDAGVLQRIREALAPDDHVFSDGDIAKNAKEVIDAADWVVGTGRSYMEAASRGKVMLCPSATHDLPILITEKTFDEAFAFNFSERVQVSTSKAENAAAILEAAGDSAIANRLRDLATKTFAEHFDRQSLVPKYEAFYARLVPSNPTDIFDVALQSLSFAKSSWQFRRSFLARQGAAKGGAEALPTDGT